MYSPSAPSVALEGVTDAMAVFPKVCPYPEEPPGGLTTDTDVSEMKYHYPRVPSLMSFGFQYSQFDNRMSAAAIRKSQRCFPVAWKVFLAMACMNIVLIWHLSRIEEPPMFMPSMFMRWATSGGDLNLPLSARPIDINKEQIFIQRFKESCHLYLTTNMQSVCGLPAIAFGRNLRALCVWKDPFLRDRVQIDPLMILLNPSWAQTPQSGNETISEVSILCTSDTTTRIERARAETITVTSAAMAESESVTVQSATSYCVQHLVDILDGVYPCTQTGYQSRVGMRPIMLMSLLPLSAKDEL